MRLHQELGLQLSFAFWFHKFVAVRVLGLLLGKSCSLGFQIAFVLILPNCFLDYIICFILVDVGGVRMTSVHENSKEIFIKP